MKTVIKENYKSIPKGLEFSLPKFSIITGINGSGKSQLLEAMANSQLSEITIDGTACGNIIHVAYNALIPQVSELCDNSSIVQIAETYWMDIPHLVNTARAYIDSGAPTEKIIDDIIAPQVGDTSPIISMLKRYAKYSGKTLYDIKLDDVYRYMDVIATDKRLFTSQCAMIFKAYHTKKIKNALNELFSTKNPQHHSPFLSDSEFIDSYGPPPWELMNSVLKNAGLSYRFNDPGYEDPDLPFLLRLVDVTTDKEISVNELSSGERVILALALAIYNTSTDSNKGQILLLDEPDAPLHPQFSKLLIDTISQTIVAKAGVTVVMTTHSPTTAAMAPDNSLFELDRLSKSLTMVSNFHAVQVLTRGIEHLKVSYENRRQIFVESKYDVEYYTRLFNILSRSKSYKYNPVFIEPHSGTSNCTDVMSIVDKLRTSGSDLAWGIIDHDNINTSQDSIIVLGEGKRYAIENYLLDPLYVCLALIRARKKSYAQFGISSGKTTYLDALDLTNNECQILTDTFLSQCSFELSELESTTLENGYTINYPKSFLHMRGHDYEQLILSKFPELNALKRNNGDSALKLSVIDIIEELRQFLPIELSKTFDKIK